MCGAPIPLSRTRSRVFLSPFSSTRQFIASGLLWRTMAETEVKARRQKGSSVSAEAEFSLEDSRDAAPVGDRASVRGRLERAAALLAEEARGAGGAGVGAAAGVGAGGEGAEGAAADESAPVRVRSEHKVHHALFAHLVP